jgi:hypothetical protein
MVLERDGRFATARTVNILLQVAEALEAAHHARVIHGDVKPNNIHLIEELGGKEGVRLNDFKLMEALAPSPNKEDPIGHLRIYNNFDYLSPEQINHGRIDGRADIYALGALAYRMVTGEPPFVGTPEQVIQGHRTRDPVPPSRRVGTEDVPSALETIILHCLEKKPEDRYKTIEEVLHHLRALISEKPLARKDKKDEAPTGILKAVEEEEPREEPLPESPAKLRRLFYDTVLALAEHICEQVGENQQIGFTIHELKRVRQEAAEIAAQNGVTENRFEDIRRELRERESTLRYAIIDLNLAKADIDERKEGTGGIKDVDAQIVELEHRLADLEQQRAERFGVLNAQLNKNRDELKALEQQLAIHYRHLYAFLEDVRLKVRTDEFRTLYRLLDRCRNQLTQQANTIQEKAKG